MSEVVIDARHDDEELLSWYRYISSEVSTVPEQIQRSNEIICEDVKFYTTIPYELLIKQPVQVIVDSCTD